MDTGKTKGPTVPPSHTNSLARSNLNNGAYSTKSNADYVENITRKKKLENLQTQSKVQDMCNAIYCPALFHQERDRIEPNFEKISKNTILLTASTSTKQTLTPSLQGDLTVQPSTRKKSCVCFQNTLEQWTLMKIGQRRRNRRKITDIAPFQASLTILVTARKAAGKLLKPTSPREFEAPSIQTSS